jgi:cyclophilin family peptidyl-prolyl cis-trans isomerase
MKIKSGMFVLGLLVFLFASISCGSKSEIDEEALVLETNYGRIVIEFISKAAPKHITNFKELAREGLFDGTRFHRLVKGKDKDKQVVAIQGGDPNTINGSPVTWGQGQEGQKKIPAEFTTINHDRGIVSAARKPEDVNSATSQFFIMVGPQPSFNGQYSVFGRVIEGMNVADSIARAPVFPRSEMPIDPVVVSRAYLVKRNEIK